MTVISKYFPLWITIYTITGLLLPLTNGFLDILIDQHEMQKLMGLDAELFYVRNGIVNNFALSFVVPVPEQVDDLTFFWQSGVETPIPYSISIEYESQLGGLLTPHINIPVRGFLPNRLESFTIHLPCMGNVSEEVPIGINLEIEGRPYFNHTKLTLKRNKICVRDETQVISDAVVFKWTVFLMAFLLVSCVLMITCYCRNSGPNSATKEHRPEPSPQTSYTIDESSSTTDTLPSSVVTTLGTTTSHKSKQVNYGCPQQRDGDYDTVVVIDDNESRWCTKDYGMSAVAGLHRPISCSSIYETIPEERSVNKFPMHIMHSNKTCGACSSSPFGDAALYDGVNVAGLVAPARPMFIGKTAGVMTPMYGQPDLVNIRWPAPPLFPADNNSGHQRRQQPHIDPSLGEQQQQLKQTTTTILGTNPRTQDILSHTLPRLYSNPFTGGVIDDGRRQQRVPPFPHYEADLNQHL